MRSLGQGEICRAEEAAALGVFLKVYPSNELLPQGKRAKTPRQAKVHDCRHVSPRYVLYSLR